MNLLNYIYHVKFNKSLPSARLIEKELPERNKTRKSGTA